MSDAPRIVAASAVPVDALRAAFNASFADYLVRFPPFDAAGWTLMLQRQGSALASSLVALRADTVVAFALVTPRPPGRTRVGVMGALPAERGRGSAARLLDAAIAAARDRGDASIELEVFAQNERAVALYRSRGFAPVGALYGYAADALAGACAAAAPQAVSRAEAVAWLDAADRAEPQRWPWQVMGEAVAATPGDVVAWRQGGAQLVFRADDAGPLAVLSLVDRDARQADATALLHALRAQHPGRALRAPPLQRDDGPARAFDAAGWAREDLHQWLMRRALAA
ncbi:MAG TPA: GNAT family N-acetyltransferase [Burkholderiaceae bacterium]|nr:GNAT family N-acetyltransferase [Burkholderiaceae bacterium]